MPRRRQSKATLSFPASRSRTAARPSTPAPSATRARGDTESGTVRPARPAGTGRLLFDPDRLRWPGGLLHEAGHIAVTDPALRPGLCEPSDDPGEEMAAIAWSWAAAMEIGLAPAILFHEGGYRGASAAFIDNFSNGRDVGVPMLAAWDMTTEI